MRKFRTSNLKKYLYTYQREGRSFDFPTAVDLEVLDVPSVKGICCRPNTTDKYTKAVIMQVGANTPEADKIYQQVWEIFNRGFNIPTFMRWKS